MVFEILLARDELLAVGGREEEAAALIVAEELDGEAGQAVRLAEPAKVSRRDVQLEEPVRDVGVVLEVAGALGLAGPEGAVQTAVVRERAEQELAERAGGLQIVGAVEPARRLGQRCEREPVPGRDRLVVAQRLRALLADLEQPRALLVAQIAADDRAPVLERLQQLLAHAFFGRPRERQALPRLRCPRPAPRRTRPRGAAARGACSRASPRSRGGTAPRR